MQLDQLLNMKVIRLSPIIVSENDKKIIDKEFTDYNDAPRLISVNGIEKKATLLYDNGRTVCLQGSTYWDDKWENASNISREYQKVLSNILTSYEKIGYTDISVYLDHIMANKKSLEEARDKHEKLEVERLSRSKIDGNNRIFACTKETDIETMCLAFHDAILRSISNGILDGDHAYRIVDENDKLIARFNIFFYDDDESKQMAESMPEEIKPCTITLRDRDAKHKLKEGEEVFCINNALGELLIDFIYTHSIKFMTTNGVIVSNTRYLHLLLEKNNVIFGKTIKDIIEEYEGKNFSYPMVLSAGIAVFTVEPYVSEKTSVTLYTAKKMGEWMRVSSMYIPKGSGIAMMEEMNGFDFCEKYVTHTSSDGEEVEICYKEKDGSLVEIDS